LADRVIRPRKERGYQQEDTAAGEKWTVQSTVRKHTKQQKHACDRKEANFQKTEHIDLDSCPELPLSA
jgi:hypothetical protein